MEPLFATFESVCGADFRNLLLNFLPAPLIQHVNFFWSFIVLFLFGTFQPQCGSFIWNLRTCAGNLSCGTFQSLVPVPRPVAPNLYWQRSYVFQAVVDNDFKGCVLSTFRIVDRTCAIPCGAWKWISALTKTHHNTSNEPMSFRRWILSSSDCAKNALSNEQLGMSMNCKPPKMPCGLLVQVAFYTFQFCCSGNCRCVSSAKRNLQILNIAWRIHFWPIKVHALFGFGLKAGWLWLVLQRNSFVKRRRDLCHVVLNQSNHVQGFFALHPRAFCCLPSFHHRYQPGAWWARASVLLLLPQLCQITHAQADCKDSGFSRKYWCFFVPGFIGALAQLLGLMLFGDRFTLVL